jgi:hypothetical protein
MSWAFIVLPNVLATEHKKICQKFIAKSSEDGLTHHEQVIGAVFELLRVYNCV